MTNNLTSELRPAGTALFSGLESFMRDLSEDDESMIAGGNRSNSNSGRRWNRRRRPNRRWNRRRRGGSNT